MSYQNQYATPTLQSQSDVYGNPVSQRDEHGNPLHHYGGSISQIDEYGNPVYYQKQEHGHGQGISGMLQRSGSSSSSEDDGYGGRRKKGLRERIKEKMPCSGQHQSRGIETTTPHEKKGVVDKIKDKLHAGHH
uniref:Dehydrin 2 n=1 Tax=Paeonia lactiflora TaxID=35924 RepID=A0A2Z2Z0N4_PAELC|nr:dehydrin 2 [Paeonia lactiflora]